MKKRIIALFLASIMVLTAVLFVGCDKTDNNGDDSSDTSANFETLSVKEKFTQSVVNTLTAGMKEQKVPSFLSNPSGKGKVTMELDVDKLLVRGQDMLQGKPASLEVTGITDTEAKTVSVDMALDIWGEKPTIAGVVTQDTIYITDMLGVNDKPVKMSLSDVLGTEMQDPDAMVGEAMNALGLGQYGIASADDLAALVTYIAEAIEAAVENNFKDEAYVSETKDVTVDGTEYKGATVITLTITPDLAKAIVADLITKIGENEVLSKIWADMYMETDDINEMIDEAFKSIVIVNTISDAKTVALDVIASAAIGGAVDVEDGEAATADEAKFAVKSAFVGNNFNIKMGMLKEDGSFDEDEGTIAVIYTLDSNGAETFKLNMTEYGETVTYISQEGTYKDGKREATLSVMDQFSVKYKNEGDNNKGSLTITEVSFNSQGTTVTIPLELKIAYEITDAKISLSMALKLALENTVDVDCKISMAIESSTGSITVPSNAMDITEIDEATAQKWVLDLSEDFPTIFGMFTGSSSGGAYEENTENAWDDNDF